MSDQPSDPRPDARRKQMLKRSSSESSSRIRSRRSHKKEQGEKGANSPETTKSKRSRAERSSGDSTDGKGDLGSGASSDDKNTSSKRGREAVSDDCAPVTSTRSKRKKYHAIVPIEDSVVAKTGRRRSRTRNEDQQAQIKSDEISNAETSPSHPSIQSSSTQNTSSPIFVPYTPKVSTIGGWDTSAGKRSTSNPSHRVQNPFSHHPSGHHHRAFQCQSPTTFQGPTIPLSSPISDGNEPHSSFSSESLGLAELTLSVDGVRSNGRLEETQPNTLLSTVLKTHLDLLRSLDESEEELRRDRSSLPASHLSPVRGRLPGPTMLQMLKGEKSQITDSSSSEGFNSVDSLPPVSVSPFHFRDASKRVGLEKVARNRRRYFEVDESGFDPEYESDNDEDNELRITVAGERGEIEGSQGGRGSSSNGSSFSSLCPELAFLSGDRDRLPPIYHSYSMDDHEAHGSPAGSSHTPSPRQQKPWTLVNKWSISPQYYPSSSFAFEDHRSEADSESPSQSPSLPQPTLPCALQYTAIPPLAQPIAVGGQPSTFANLLGSDLNQNSPSRADIASKPETMHLPTNASGGIFFSPRSAFAPKRVPQHSN